LGVEVTETPSPSLHSSERGFSFSVFGQEETKRRR